MLVTQHVEICWSEKEPSNASLFRRPLILGCGFVGTSANIFWPCRTNLWLSWPCLSPNEIVDAPSNMSFYRATAVCSGPIAYHSIWCAFWSPWIAPAAAALWIIFNRLFRLIVGPSFQACSRQVSRHFWIFAFSLAHVEQIACAVFLWNFKHFFQGSAHL